MDLLPQQPLTPAVFHILLALSKGDRHGYEIMKAVREDSDNKIKMGNGTLYGSIKRMLSDGLIEEGEERTDADDARRKYYRLTALGREALAAEARRYLNTSEVLKRYQLDLAPALEATR